MQPESFDFDSAPDRRGTDSAKWNYMPADVLPMWVADMDFRSPQPVIDALIARAQEGHFGYASNFPHLFEVIRARLQRLYGWTVAQEEIVLMPGLVCGLNVVAAAVGEPGDGILANTPVYGPFLTAPANQGRVLHTAAQEVVVRADGTLHYEANLPALEAAIDAQTRLFFLCSPHNPTGRMWRRSELETFADLAGRHDLVICSDDIHCDLLLEERPHIPLATLAPEVAARTITLLAPNKTYNLPGLGASLAVVQDKELRQRVEKAASGIVPHLDLLAAHAMAAAYSEACDPWLHALRAYLRANRDFAVEFIQRELPMLRCTRPEATYLLWVDCSALGLDEPADKHFMKKAKVAFTGGAFFGAGHEQFIRINFGCPRATLAQGLACLRDAIVSG